MSKDKTIVDCCFPNCPNKAQMQMWVCRDHWLELPEDLRKETWASFIKYPMESLKNLPNDEYYKIQDKVVTYAESILP